MECKNCKTDLLNQYNYCGECGAKVIHERITLRNIMSSLFANAFGWDNKFFVTIKNLIVRPEIPLKEYINGTRKKFVEPFAFFAIGAALTLLIFNFFSEEFIRQANELKTAELQILDESANEEIVEFSSKANPNFKEPKVVNERLDRSKIKFQQALLKYFNFYSFLSLPLYAFIAFIVFGRPYNFGEHLIINAYVQGLLLLLSIIVFFADLLTGLSSNFTNLVASLLYYPYAYQRLYKLSAAKTIFSLLKFVMLLILILILLVLSSLIVSLFSK